MSFKCISNDVCIISLQLYLDTHTENINKQVLTYRKMYRQKWSSNKDESLVNDKTKILVLGNIGIKSKHNIYGWQAIFS